MSLTDLPPLNALRAFAAVAQTGSYVKAGELLHVTHAAVSQQVRGLEERLQTSLVTRDGRSIRLTREGLMLARELDSGFSIIDRGIRKLQDSSSTHPVQLSTSPAFAMEWLMPRIQGFQTLHPDIPLMVNPTSRVVDLRPGGIEVAVRYCDRDRLEREVEPVLVSDMVVIARPDVVRDKRIEKPADLLDMPWLQELDTNEVAYWFALHGVRLERPLMITQMPGNLIMQALRNGDGISFTARAFFEKEIDGGRMQALFSLPAFGIYHIATSPGPMRPSVRKFVDWLQSESSRVVKSPN